MLSYLSKEKGDRVFLDGIWLFDQFPEPSFEEDTFVILVFNLGLFKIGQPVGLVGYEGHLLGYWAPEVKQMANMKANEM